MRMIGTFMLVVVALLTAQSLLAGPLRNHTLVQSESEQENQSAYSDTHPSVPFDQDATVHGRKSSSNHGYVNAAEDSFTTYIDADIAIWIIAAGGPWVKKYGLFGNDTWNRQLTITNVELPRFEYRATAGSTVLAQAKLNGGFGTESGDIYARANGLLRFKVDGAIVAISDKECLAGTKNLDHADKPAIESGSYTYPDMPGDPNENGKAANYSKGKTAEAELKLSIDVPKTPKLDSTLELDIFSFANVRVWVDSTNAWGKAQVKHLRYPPPAGSVPGATGPLPNDDWEVVVELWDDDEAGNEVNFKTFKWTAWGDEE